jgi:hypothetical protein
MRVLLCWLVGGFATAWVPATAQPAKQALAVSISAEAPAVRTGLGHYTVKAGSAIFVTVHMTNVSDHSLSLDYDSDSRTGVAFADRYEIRGPNGSFLRKRTISHPEIGSTGHGWPARILAQGASVDFAGDQISRLYYLELPGVHDSAMASLPLPRS